MSPPPPSSTLFPYTTLFRNESGWRTGNSKWSATWPDNLPAVVNLGQGSPTNVVTGTHPRYPDRYKKAAHAYEWSFGMIYAVYMTPYGATNIVEVIEMLFAL